MAATVRHRLTAKILNMRSLLEVRHGAVTGRNGVPTLSHRHPVRGEQRERFLLEASGRPRAGGRRMAVSDDSGDRLAGGGPSRVMEDPTVVGRVMGAWA